MSNNRFFLGNDLNNMTPAAAGVAAPKTIFKSEDGILLCYGITMPPDASVGYAPSCIFIHTDGTAGSAIYVNEGTKASSDFDLVTVA